MSPVGKGGRGKVAKAAETAGAKLADAAAAAETHAKATAKPAAKAPDAETDAPLTADAILPRARELGAKAYQDGTQVMQDASELLNTVQQIGHEVGSNLSKTLEHRPYAVLGGAAAVGFVLGRGLTLGMSRSLIGWGGKFALSIIMRRVTQSLSPFA